MGRRAESAAWAAYVVLYMAPAGWTAIEAREHAYWIIGAAGWALWIGALGGAPHRRGGWAALIGGATTLASVPFIVSLYTQSTGFNERFFAHVDAASAAMAWRAYKTEIAIVVAHLALATAGPLLIARWARNKQGQAIPRGRRIAGALAGALAFAPAVSLTHYGLEQAVQARAPAITLTPAQTAPEARRGRPNLILVVAESLEATFGDESVVGRDLTPRLTALEREGLRFADMRQIDAGSWTVGGMVAALCAVPIAVERRWMREGWSQELNTITGTSEDIVQGWECLGDTLERLGYTRVYYSSTWVDMGGLGRFLEHHGFEEQQGWEALSAKARHRRAQGEWGLHDAEMLDLAWTRLEELEEASRQEGTPYVMMLSTIDTHNISARNVSRACGRAPLRYEGPWALDCADRLLSRFIAKAREAWPRTMVVLISDHLDMDGDPITDRIRDPGVRKLRFVAWTPQGDKGTIERAGTQLDIAPTTLDLMGIASHRRMNAGASLLAFESPWLSHEDPSALKVAARTLRPEIGRGDSVTFEPAGPSIDIGGQAILANLQGYALETSVFTMRFDAQGRFDTTLPWQTLEELEANERGAMVIGISANESFNKALGGSGKEKLRYFVGRVGEELGSGAVTERVRVRIGGAR